MNETKEFDGIRGIAILSIVDCHICYVINALSPIRLYIGCRFNIVFFILWGLLIGLSIRTRKSQGGVSSLEQFFLKEG